MEQIIKYSDIKTLTDINKNFARVPMGVQTSDGSSPIFTIVDYNEFKATIENILKNEYDREFDISEDNVVIYEKEASQIKKLATKIKADAVDFCDQFTIQLLGKKNKHDGQVQEMEKLLMAYYDKIHQKTVAYRDSVRIEPETAIEVETVEVKEESKKVAYTIEVDSSKAVEFENYCRANGIQIKCITMIKE